MITPRVNDYFTKPTTLGMGQFLQSCWSGLPKTLLKHFKLLALPLVATQPPKGGKEVPIAEDTMYKT